MLSNFNKRYFLLIGIVFIVSNVSALAHVKVSSADTNHQASQSTELKETDIWISLGADALKLIKEQHSEEMELIAAPEQNKVFERALKTNQLLNTGVIVKVKNSQIEKLSHLMHKHFNRCPGFIAHASYEDAVSAIRLFKTANKTNAVEYTINNGVVVSELLTQISDQNLTSTVTNLSNFNNRFYTQQSGVDAANWIKDEWALIASTRDDVEVELYQHSGWSQPSVIATITGTTLPDEIVVIGGHLDSINGVSPTTGRAPGVDDNASGIAIVTEVLNSIVASGFRPERTIQLIGYAAEEVGLRGSNEIAQQYFQDNKDVVGAAQFDMTGFRGTQGQDFTFITDFTNAEQNQFMVDLVDTYLDNLTYGFDRCGYACSDHASWSRFGFSSSFPFESNFNDSNGYIHTSADTSFDSTHAINFAQLAVIFAAELAKGSTDSGNLVANVMFANSELQADGNSELNIAVRRTGSNLDAVSVDFQTVNGSAIGGTDYVSSSGKLTWDALDGSEKIISLTLNTVDTDKSFSVVLSNPQGGELGINTTINITVKAEEPADDSGATSSSGGGTLGLYIIFLFSLMLIARMSKISCCYEKASEETEFLV